MQLIKVFESFLQNRDVYLTGEGYFDVKEGSEFEHHRARNIYSNPSDYSEIERAWAIWVLSKQSIYSILDNSWSMSVERNIAKSVQWPKDVFTASYAKRL